MTTFLIGYDIKNRRRLQKVRKKAASLGVPLQLSVFILNGTEAAAKKCFSELRKLIDPGKDDLRCYALPARGAHIKLGRSVLPAGIYLKLD